MTDAGDTQAQPQIQPNDGDDDGDGAAALLADTVAAIRPLDGAAVLSLELRLGEGSGAVLALPVVATAARVLREVATFDSAGVSGGKG